MKTFGMLKLDTKFPRILGDCCHPATWPFPMLQVSVSGATAKKVVREQGDGTLDEFILQGRKLKEQGAMGVTTSCGFMSLHRDVIREAIGIPVMLSSLQILPMLQEKHGDVGVMTFSAENLTDEHFLAVDVKKIPTVAGIDKDSHFAEVIFEDLTTMDIKQTAADNVDTALRLKESNPNIQAILMECTNMPPYKREVEAAVGVPVYSIYDAVMELYNSL